LVTSLTAALLAYFGISFSDEKNLDIPKKSLFDGRIPFTHLKYIA
jgi:hypothetical protein